VTTFTQPSPVHVGIFGKHPAWADHVEWAELDQLGLARFKRVVYDDGVQGAMRKWVVSGEDSADRVIASAESNAALGISAFDHALCWTDETFIVLAILQPSKDASGRGNYPAVLFAKLPVWADEKLMAATFRELEVTLDRVRHESDRGAVVSALREAEGTLRDRLTSTERFDRHEFSPQTRGAAHARAVAPAEDVEAFLIMACEQSLRLKPRSPLLLVADRLGGWVDAMRLTEGGVDLSPIRLAGLDAEVTAAHATDLWAAQALLETVAGSPTALEDAPAERPEPEVARPAPRPTGGGVGTWVLPVVLVLIAVALLAAAIVWATGAMTAAPAVVD
jgi:hypothetical protein